MREIAAFSELPIIVEGRIQTPAQAADALAAGGYAVCVGTAITHSTSVTGWFRRAIETAPGGRSA